MSGYRSFRLWSLMPSAPPLWPLSAWPQRLAPSQAKYSAQEEGPFAVPCHRSAGKIWAEDPTTSKSADLSLQEHRAFGTWAAIEVLRHTGIRVEELAELSHHSFIEHKLASTGELILPFCT